MGDDDTRYVLVTGSRHAADHKAIGAALDEVLERLGPFVLVHGGASGTDTLAGQWAARRGLDVEVHPADWKRHGRAAGPIRNNEMVALGADLVVAFPQGESRGTRQCINAARKAGLVVEVHELRA